MASIEEFHQRATDCLTLSERSKVPRHKELFLRMAQTWLALADEQHNATAGLDRNELTPAPSPSELAAKTGDADNSV